MDKSQQQASAPIKAKSLMKIPDALRDDIIADSQAETVPAGLDGVVGGVASSFLIPAGAIDKLIGSLPFDSSIGIVAQVAVRAEDISTDHAPIWFVNFPPSPSSTDQALLRQYMQEIVNFRSWSSLKWWADVFGSIPFSDSAMVRMQQSSQFARVAFRSLVQMPWLHTLKEPTSFSDAFDCPVWELHQNLINRTMSTWSSLDAQALSDLEPVLKRVVSSVDTSSSMTSYNQIKSVLSERYEYQTWTKTIKSYLRLVCFEVSEAVRDVQDGKNSSHRQVECKISYMFYEAEFDMQAWKNFSASINEQQKTACRDFVLKQTVDMSP